MHGFKKTQIALLIKRERLNYNSIYFLKPQKHFYIPMLNSVAPFLQYTEGYSKIIVPGDHKSTLIYYIKDLIVKMVGRV